MTGQTSTPIHDHIPRHEEEDTVFMLASGVSSRAEQAGNLPYVSDSHRNNSLDDAASQPPPPMGYSVFGDNPSSGELYQEQVAWANCTQFGVSTLAATKPQMVQTTYLGTTNGIPSPSRNYFRLPRHILEPWATGIWSRFPWWGFGAVSLILLLTGVSTSILLISHGTSPEAWKTRHDNIQPYLYLSVFEMAMNLLVLFALAEGMVIRFWRQLLRGTTISSIHDTYDSMHLFSATKRILRLKFNAVAVACILASTTFARGPLFQRALTLAENERQNIAEILDFKIAPRPVPLFFNGSQSDQPGHTGFTPLFSDVIKGLVAGESFPYEQPHSCGDHCTGTVKSYSLRASCELEVRNINLNTAERRCEPCTTAQCESNCQSRRETGINTTFFSVRGEQIENKLVLSSVHKNTTSCNGDVYVQKCTLTEVNGDFPIVLTNGTIDRQPGVSVSRFYEDMSTDQAFANYYWPLAFKMLFPPVVLNVSATPGSNKLDYTRCLQPSLNSPKTSTPIICSNSTFFPTVFPNDPSVTYAKGYETKPDEDPTCGLSWNDPMPDMISKMQSLAFRTTVAMATAPGDLYTRNLTSSALADERSLWKQQVHVTGYRTLSLYHTSPLLVALGIIVSVAGVLAILPLYYGFWELGRKVTLNPLEIARAFGSPIMEDLDGNTTAEMITVERGDMRVRYGALDRYGQQKQLRVQPTAECNVRRPWEGEIFG